MFLFSCCTSGEGEFSYQIRSKHEKLKKLSSAANIQQRINQSKDEYLLKIRRSSYQQLLKQKSNSKWTDHQFSPSKQSLGYIPQISTCNWKRLSQIVSKPILYSSMTKSHQILKQNQNSCYFVSGISAILENPKKINDIFVTQQINKAGIYCVKMRINGNIEEVIVDDYVPVNQMGNTIFTAPVNSEICIPLLQKAWAKVNGSYANIINGNPAQIFKAFTFAPSQIFLLQDKQQKKQKIWKLLNDAIHRKSPICCATSQNQQISWRNINLVPFHRYNLIHLDQVTHKNQNSSYRVLKLKNPQQSSQNWQGKGSLHDKDFWQNITQSKQKSFFMKYTQQQHGQFLILFTDFVKYFYQIDISYQFQKGNYLWEDIYFNGKNGSFWQINVTHEGQYCFQLHQKSLRNQKNIDQKQQYNRSSLLLAKVVENKKYQYISGCMKFTQQDVLVHSFLTPGNYIIYAKIDFPKNKSQISFLQNKSSLSCYSTKICKLNLLQKKQCEGFLQSVFLNFGRINKRQLYNNDKMWISWRLFFKQCGFAFIAFGNNHDSNKKFTIKFQSKDFQVMNFKLKSPFKSNRNGQNKSYELTVLPGEQKIILARVINNRVTSLKFPPPIQMKMEQL